jgi:hypothetical protein
MRILSFKTNYKNVVTEKLFKFSYRGFNRPTAVCRGWCPTNRKTLNGNFILR